MIFGQGFVAGVAVTVAALVVALSRLAERLYRW
jgi:hypothetical protein